MKINLHIERLVVDGLNISIDQRYLLKSTVITELSRMLTDGKLSSGLREGAILPSISTSGIRLSADGNTVQLGQQIAHSMYEGIGND